MVKAAHSSISRTKGNKKSKVCSKELSTCLTGGQILESSGRLTFGGFSCSILSRDSKPL